MIRLYSLRAVILTAALGLVAGLPAFGQAKKQTHRAPRAQSSAAGQGKAAGLGFGVPESLTGKVQLVVAGQNLLVVQGPNNVPYDLKVTPKTLVVVNEKRGTIQSLADQVGKPVTVSFVPQRDGDYATRVEVTD